MEYRIHYGYVRDDGFVGNLYREEILHDGKEAMKRYCELQRLGEKGEDEVSLSFFPPENARFNCSCDIYVNGVFHGGATLEFFFDAFDILNKEHEQK